MNLVRRGSRINFGMWPFISDLRTGAFSGGSGEEALITAATVQLGSHFGFMTSIGAGMTDSKTMDAQAGYEKALTVAAAALSGCNQVSSYPGIVGSLMGQSFEGMLIDNDMIGNVQRMLRGIEVNEETLPRRHQETVCGPAPLGHPRPWPAKSEFLPRSRRRQTPAPGGR
jgi:trimethylamine--corrinoid protein Co-methyltransferase